MCVSWEEHPRNTSGAWKKMKQVELDTIRIRRGKEKQLVRHHPWVFSGAVEPGASFGPSDPGIVRVLDADGRFIAYGWHDAKSHILVRLLSWDERLVPDDGWWMDILRASILRRKPLFAHARHTNAFRLVHGEADLLPGLVVDMFGTTIVCNISARVAWDHRLLVVRTVQRLLNPVQIILMTDPAFCKIEQLREVIERYADGELVPLEGASEVRFKEHGMVYTVEPGEGQKSGFFCDQRENRRRVATYAKGRTCLDAFCYTGSFSLNLLAAGSGPITAVDSSLPALKTLLSQLERNVEERRLPRGSLERLTVRQADVFTYLRGMETGLFDLIILDPPKLARTKAQVEGALRAYKDLNRLAIEKIASGGIIATFSCSSAVSREHLRTVIAWAAKDAGREVQILETLGQGQDHPVRLSFPESEYLKGFILTVW